MTDAYVAVASVDDLWDGEMDSVEVDGEEVLLLRLAGQYHAYQGNCPHQGAALADGDLDGATLTCRLHEWVFDARTGAGINPRVSRLTRYPVRIVAGTVQVGRCPVRT
ncbi:MAG TPA: Rieske 2Fe-2S domain-containing protein [Rugosimonospora sp.]|nr:Rieske 2Fe-2S domain-containing protein [Rugosimonospora sp.]